MDEQQLDAFYAESARRREVAQREFQARRHGWHFGLAPGADQWAESYAAEEDASASGPSGWAARLVERADEGGVILKPEPGKIRSAFSHRDSFTEETTAIGFGFWPDDAEILVLHAGHAIPFDQVTAAIGGDGAALLAVLRLVVESFATVTAFSAPPGAARP
jgi:hypothetical protein